MLDSRDETGSETGADDAPALSGGLAGDAAPSPYRAPAAAARGANVVLRHVLKKVSSIGRKTKLKFCF